MRHWLIALSAVALFVACGEDSTEEEHEHEHEHEEAVPEQYANLTNPLEGNADAITAGQTIFAQQCVSCHGDDAKGGGPAGASLDPPPADLTADEEEFTDGFLYWHIADGAEGMPAYASTLSEEQIWQAISYLRSLMI
ncbi:MAG: c-type cytochrome [Myxococcales bacterium]|nr:c-type cytochrome [Myxococcales bacterium]